MVQLYHSDDDPGANDDLLIFSSSAFNASEYIVQFHTTYIQNERDGLKYKLRRRRRQVDARLENQTMDQLTACLRISEDHRNRGEPLLLKLMLDKYQSCLQSLMACSFLELPAAALQESEGNSISGIELHSIQNLIDDGMLQLAANAVADTRQLALSSTQEQTLNQYSECLKSVLLYGIHQQMMLGERQPVRSGAHRFPDFMLSLSLLVKLEKQSHALTAFFEFHTSIQEKILSKIWAAAEVDSAACSVSTISSCSEAIISALQEFEQIFADHFPMSKFTIWAVSQLTTASIAIAELLSYCDANDFSKAVLNVQDRLKLLAEYGFNFWFLFENALSKISRKRINHGPCHEA